MSYCFNPWCTNRQGLEDSSVCQTCGTPLVLKDRYVFERNLIELTHPHPYTEVYLVRDAYAGDRLRVMKTLKVDNLKLIELFEQERDLLSDLRHRGLPNYESYFSLVLAKPRRELRCLVMEYIDGVNLEQWVEDHGRIDEGTALDWLEELTIILGYVHSKKFFHRDIKPSNIIRRQQARPGEALVLIDFGTAREYTDTVINGCHVTQVVSHGYTAPEQIAGKAVPQSDFFALGRTFVYLLTAYPPDIDPLPTHWKFQTRCPNSPLIDLIGQLTQSQPDDRPQTAAEILQAIHAIRQHTYVPISPAPLPAAMPAAMPAMTALPPPSPVAVLSVFNPGSKFWRWFFLGLALVCLLGLLSVSPLRCYLFPFPSCPVSRLPGKSDSQNLLISTGTSVLMTDSTLIEDLELASVKEKQAGVDLFQAAEKSGRYEDAIATFEQLHQQQKKDPELLVYLNNAVVRQRQIQTGNPLYTIAVIVPLNLDAGISILRGVAQAQDQAVEQGINLQVVIVNDQNNDQAVAPLVTQLLALQPNLLAVVGHYTSEVTLQAIATYQEAGLTIISPTSTAKKLADEWGTKPKRVFSRTVYATSVEAGSLVNQAITLIPNPNVAVFYSSKEFPQSLRNEFVLALKKAGGTILEPEFNLDSRDFNATQWLATAQKADMIVLFPDGKTNDPTAFNRSLALIQENYRLDRKPILASNTLYLAEVLEKAGQETACRLIITTGWYPLPGDRFTEEANRSWGGNVNYRAAFAYDAVQVILAAIDQKSGSVTREQIRAAITAPGFVVGKSATGQGSISFTEDGNRREITTLTPLTVVRNPNDAYEYDLLKNSSCLKIP